MKNLIKLEKRLQGKMKAVKNNEMTPAESGVGVLMNLLKGVDEVSYDKHIAEYKNILQGIKK